MYDRVFNITDKDFCTFSPSGRCCSFGDSGAPFVVGRRLVGVHSWGSSERNRLNPDVFMNLAHPEYINWIMSIIRPHARNPYNPRNPHNLPGSHHP